MKVRDSGMPEENWWESFFNPAEVVRAFGLEQVEDVVEFGCGYGTFTIPAAKACRGTVIALDIEPEMVSLVERKSFAAGVRNIICEVRDFVAHGTGLPGVSMDAALLFNILHHDEPVALLREACRTLKPGGVAAVIHWNHDPTTPRGPAMEIRPRPEQCVEWAQEAGFLYGGECFNFKPHHYGLIFRKEES